MPVPKNNAGKVDGLFFFLLTLYYSYSRNIPAVPLHTHFGYQRM